MDKKIYELAYKLNEELLNLINQRDLDTLKSMYRISPEMFEEIEEVINDVGVDLKKTSLKIKEKLRDILECDNGEFIIEADLITIKGERTDLTLITELNKFESRYRLDYRQIEVM